jgi:putative transposase
VGTTLANLLIHVVFSTKNREPLIHQEVEAELHAYIAVVCRAKSAHALKVGGVEDHVHILLNPPRTVAVSKLLEDVKKSTSKWIKTKGSQYRQFAWQTGYGAISVSPSHKAAVYQYISKQRKHHQTVTFQDEYRRILNKNQIEYDERYLWD